jgi:hypothetical protein
MIYRGAVGPRIFASTALTLAAAASMIAIVRIVRPYFVTRSEAIALRYIGGISFSIMFVFLCVGYQMGPKIFSPPFVGVFVGATLLPLFFGNYLLFSLMARLFDDD